jgi:hypothetical protein
MNANKDVTKIRPEIKEIEKYKTSSIGKGDSLKRKPRKLINCW